MYKVMMMIDGKSYIYGKWDDKDVAVRIAVEISLQRNVKTYVEKE